MVIQGEYPAKWPFSNCKPPLKFIMNGLNSNIIYALLSLSECVSCIDEKLIFTEHKVPRPYSVYLQIIGYWFVNFAQ